MEREPERIEVELTPTSAPHVRSPRRSSEASSPRNLLATERSRLIVTGFAVGVIALGVGWLAGRAGGDNAAFDGGEPSTTTGVPTTTTLVPDAAANNTIAPVATTTRPTTTTSTLPPAYTLPAVIDQRLVGSGVQLVGVDARGGLLELDFDAGTLKRSESGSTNIEAQSLFVGDDWTAHVSYDQTPGLVVVTTSGDRRMIITDNAWQILHEPGTDLFWQPMDISQNGFPTRWEEVDISGLATGRVVGVPAGWGVGVDPLGGLVVQESAKNYRVEADGNVTLLADGNLLGFDARLVVYRGCDDRLICSIWVLDRSTGDRRPLLLSDVGDAEIASLTNWGPPSQPAAIAPTDDAVAVIRFSSTSTVLSLIDLATGAITDLTELREQSPTVSWSADGDRVFFLDGDVPMCLDRSTGEMFAVAAEVDGWLAAQVRPVAG